MKLFKISFLLVLLLIASDSLMAQYTTFNLGGRLLSYELQGQQQSQWCWASSGSMVMTYVSPNNAPSQCSQATEENGGDCCNDGSSSTCNQPGWPKLSKYGYTSSRTNGVPLTFEQIKQVLQNNSPICFTWYWTSGGGHMMTVDGWGEFDGVPYVHVQDPGPVNEGTSKWITYKAYVSGGHYTHGTDIYDIRR